MITDTHFESEEFGTTSAGQSVMRWTLRNHNGLLVRLINFGATVTELHVPDRCGKLADVVLGFDKFAQYESQSPYFGCTVGRVAFRIPYARFELDGNEYELTTNYGGPHHLHGGAQGFSWVVWNAEPLEIDSCPSVRFSHISLDGDQGYPGRVEASVTYSLTGDDALRISYRATCDQATPLDMTHHSYFNLVGHAGGPIWDHIVQIHADEFSETDADLIATGRLLPLRNTRFDFCQPRQISSPAVTSLESEQGYDLAYLLRSATGELKPAASVFEPATGRRMEVLTDSPALIFYTGDYLDGTLSGKDRTTYDQHGGLALETASLPDAVHHANFPPIILRPGEVYERQCVYRFTTE